jgi:hypothetical protein
MNGLPQQHKSINRPSSFVWLASYTGWLKSLHITIDCADVKKAKTKTGSFAAAIKL